MSALLCILMTFVAAIFVPLAYANESITDEDGLDPRVPRYHYFRPSWAMQLSGSNNALGGTGDWIKADSGAKTTAISLALQYQPPIVQTFGVISIGPSFSLYPTSSSGNLTASTGLGGSTLSVWSVGGQAQYQLRIFREQPLVPYAGISFESLHYRFSDGTSGSVMANGPYFGAALLLNMFDSAGAAEFYANHGVLRSYLVGELRSLSGSASAIALSGQSVYVGIRGEF